MLILLSRKIQIFLILSKDIFNCDIGDSVTISLVIKDIVLLNWSSNESWSAISINIWYNIVIISFLFKINWTYKSNNNICGYIFNTFNSFLLQTTLRIFNYILSLWKTNQNNIKITNNDLFLITYSIILKTIIEFTTKYLLTILFVYENKLYMKEKKTTINDQTNRREIANMLVIKNIMKTYS